MYQQSTPFEVNEFVYTRDLGIESGVHYKFRVAAVNAIGEGMQSSESDPFIAAEVPSAPLLLQ